MKYLIERLFIVVIWSGVWLLGITSATAQVEGQSDDVELEEVTVTGSYIKKKSFSEAGSPVDVVDVDDIRKDAPTGKITSFLRHIPQNVGDYDSSFDDAITAGKWGGGNVNLRGLGAGATLVLLNGHRQVRFAATAGGLVDINTLVPSIAIERVEVLNDGASSTYGSDAVSGVFNFITRDDFEGVEIRGDARGTQGFTKNTFEHNNQTLGILLGSSLAEGDIHFTGAFEYFKQDGLRMADLDVPASLFLNQGFSSWGMPGSYHVPTRDIAGDLVLSGEAAPRVPDPDCATVEAQGITADPDFTTPSFVDGTLCRVKVGQVSPLLADEERWIGRASVKWDITSSTTFVGAFSAAQVKAGLSSMSSLPFLSPFAVMPGTHPANPFRAVDSDGNPLYAQDANSDGIPDRDAGNVVLLAPVPTIQSVDTIPFNEDVAIRMRPLSTTTHGSSEDENHTRVLRVDAGLVGDFGDNLSWNLHWTYSDQELTQAVQDTNRILVQNALDGLGGITGDKYFNPLASALLGTGPANDQDVIDGLIVSVVDIFRTTHWSVDGVISAHSLFELPAGPVAWALGVQYRNETLEQNFDNSRNQALTGFFNTPSEDFGGQSKTWAVFLETAIPLYSSGANTLDMTVAGRYEYEDSGLDTFDPKISLAFQNDLLTLMGSWSTSFLVPSLFQRSAKISVPNNVNDPVTGIVNTQVTTQIVGNPDLDPQSSTSLSFSVELRPMDNFTFDVNYWHFEYEDLLVTPSPQGILDADPNGPLVIRDSFNNIALLRLPVFNAASIEADGFDIGVSYDILTDGYGDIRLSIDSTWTKTYDIREVEDGPVIDGIGLQNRSNIGSSMAEWKATARMDWDIGNHSVNIAARHFSEVTRINEGNSDSSDAVLLIDASYTYTFSNQNLTTTIGALNLFNDKPNVVTTTDAEYYIRNVQDFRGRMLHVNFVHSF